MNPLRLTRVHEDKTLTQSGLLKAERGLSAGWRVQRLAVVSRILECEVARAHARVGLGEARPQDSLSREGMRGAVNANCPALRAGAV